MGLDGAGKPNPPPKSPRPPGMTASIILPLNYVAIPNFPQKNIDPTFIASVFTGVLASFGIQTAKDKKNAGKPAPGAISKGDLEKLIAAASQTAPAQTIRIEQAPVKLANADEPKK